MNCSNCAYTLNDANTKQNSIATKIKTVLRYLKMSFEAWILLNVGL